MTPALAGQETAQALVPVSETAAILSMIERAARDPAVDMDKFERLMAMKERALVLEARMAYAAAFSKMVFPPIPKLGKGHNNKSYALWEDINEKIKPVLAGQGFSLSFRTKDSPNGIEITAVLLHAGGHSEETTKTFPADTSGSKNAIQALGSSISYGKRYTAVALLNLTTTEEDDDGEAGGVGDRITDEQAAELRTLAEEVNADVAKFCRYMKAESIPDIPAKDFDRAVAALEAKRAKK